MIIIAFNILSSTQLYNSKVNVKISNPTMSYFVSCNAKIKAFFNLCIFIHSLAFCLRIPYNLLVELFIRAWRLDTTLWSAGGVFSFAVISNCTPGYCCPSAYAIALAIFCASFRLKSSNVRSLSSYHYITSFLSLKI